MTRPGAPARIAIVKPEWGFTGGAELVVDHIEQELVAAGHRVERVPVDATGRSRRPYGVAIPDEVWQATPEFFRYLAMWDAFASTDVRGYDVVLATQPPSWAVDHPCVLALFYHHLRVFYDLSELYIRAGFVEAEPHLAAQQHVRRLDQERFDRMAGFLAPATPARRLAHFNGCTNVTPYDAGPASGVASVGADGRSPAERAAARRSASGALCMSRSEFPKRTELFVAAMHLATPHRGHLVGTGGRLGLVRMLDAQFAADPDRIPELTDTDLWCNRGDIDRDEVPPPDPRSNVTIHGWVSDGALGHLYRSARCLVAPAYDEDYGLTAIEAMAHGLPVIVCRDGGGLADIVEDGRSGLVVDPTPAAIAEAVTRLHTDDDLAEQLAAGALERAAAFTWERAEQQLLTGLATALEHS